jgi:CRISPR/Cas system CMR subunit Cmr4 (Cas7 group RAMP superfamily)
MNPEARAGLALSVGLGLLSNEASEPVPTEFRRLFLQLNLGASLDHALQDLVKRKPLVDDRFFASTVMLQRETGGNFAENLTKLSNGIGERFRMKGQVRALSAHGRMKADVITAEGVDWVEEHLPRNKVLYHLLKAAESGKAHSASPEDFSPSSEADNQEGDLPS